MNPDVLGAVQAFAAIGSLLVGFAIAGLAIRWIYLRSGRPASLTGGELDELRARVAELEAERGHLAELEERLDFAERLLAQQRGPARLGEGDR